MADQFLDGLPGSLIRGRLDEAESPRSARILISPDRERFDASLLLEPLPQFRLSCRKGQMVNEYSSTHCDTPMPRKKDGRAQYPDAAHLLQDFLAMDCGSMQGSMEERVRQPTDSPCRASRSSFPPNGD
jgi:hypothetical protein